MQVKHSKRLGTGDGNMPCYRGSHTPPCKKGGGREGGPRAAWHDRCPCGVHMQELRGRAAEGKRKSDSFGTKMKKLAAEADDLVERHRKGKATRQDALAKVAEIQVGAVHHGVRMSYFRVGCGFLFHTLLLHLPACSVGFILIAVFILQ